MRFASFLVAVCVLPACVKYHVVEPWSPSTGAEPLCSLVASLADTAPGFELRKSPPSVLVVLPADATPFQQKLAVEMRKVVQENGGVLAADPKTADLVVAVDAAFFSRQEQQVRTAVARRWGSFSLHSSANGWSLGSAYTVAEVPLVMTKEVGYAKVQIDLFEPVQGALHHGWHGELQCANWGSFRTYPHSCLAALFRRFGGPDGMETF